jgi:phosphoribosylformylglycinamidine synthase I
MSVRPTAAILVAPGTNRDRDVALALNLAGADSVVVSITDLERDANVINTAQMIVIAGGFSFADALGSGHVFALELEMLLGDRLQQAVGDGRPIIGICNGFQTLVRMGLLSSGAGAMALDHNEHGLFDCRWVTLQPSSEKCVWTQGIQDNIECPIAHGEGRFTADGEVVARLKSSDRIALRYVNGNPNGSADDIAGICDESGLVLGLMPHPENHVVPRQHPNFLRGTHQGLALELFRNGVAHASA